MRKTSKKRAKQLKIYRSLRDKYLEENLYCEKCGRFGTILHHKNGRTGERLYDINYFMAVCDPCHKWIHEHPKESREKGWLI